MSTNSIVLRWKRISKTQRHFLMRNMMLMIFTLSGVMIAAEAIPAAEDSEPKPIRLTRIRSITGKGYAALIFKFDRTIQAQNPEIRENEIITRFDRVTTTLKTSREYANIDSWVELEPEEGRMTARIGLPKDFSRMDHYLNPRKNKWIIRLYKKKPDDPAGRTEEAEPPVPKNPETPPATPAVEKETEPQETVRSNGLLTLNFFQSDIQEILSALAIEREINIATAQNVGGKVSVHLYQVTLEEALNAIALAGGFQYQKKDDLYYVYKSKQARDLQSEKREMRIFRLQYAETDKIAGILNALPNMGTIQIHKPSRTLIIEDTPANIEKVETILGHWDRRPKQVLIEAKILEVTLTDGMEFGVDWAKVLGEFNIGTQGFSRARLPTTEPISPMPGGDAAGIFGNLITAIGTHYQFSLALDALQNKTKVNTLSTPKVLAVHGKAAKVQVGGQQGYRVTTTNLGVATESIQFIDTGTILEITPYIDDNDGVLLNVLPSIQDATVDEGIPVVTSTNVATWLLANSGETVFIGGLIKDKDEKVREGLPCFGNLPAVGPLFGKTSMRYRKTELVVMITPIILGDSLQHIQQKEKDKIHREDKKFSTYPLPPPEQIREFIKPME